MAVAAPAQDLKLETLPLSIEEAANELKMVSLSLRSCYNVNDASVPKFRALRDDFTASALVYKQKIYPLASAVVKDIDTTFTIYETYSLDEFREDLKAIITMAGQFAARADWVRQAHKEVLIDLKGSQDKAAEVLATLKLEEERFRENAKKLQSSADTKNGWAIGLAFIPVVGAIAAPILSSQAKDDINEAIAAATEAEIVVAATYVIKDTLMVALERFIKCVEAFAGFFHVLQLKLQEIADTPGDEVLRLHLKVVQARAKEIKKSTEQYLKLVPGIETDLDAIPNASDKQNYVQTWLQTKKSEKGDKSLWSFASDVFKGVKAFSNMLESSKDEDPKANA